MYQLNDKDFLTYIEKIDQNAANIAKHWDVDRVLADYGIRVRGQVISYDIIKDMDEGDNIGYAYLVGMEPPYDVYVWTGANPDAGHNTNYWLNIGAISIVGPVGPAGKSISNATLNSSDQLVLTFTDGSVQTIPKSLKGNSGAPGKDGGTPSVKVIQTSTGATIQAYGPTGALTSSATITNGKDGQSIQGPKGDPGSFSIKGTFISVSELTALDITKLNPGDAYLVTTASGYDLWVVVGTAPANYEWVNTGGVGVGSIVTINGNAQSTWSADTKVDKVTTGGSARVYGVTSSNAQTMVKYSTSAMGSALAQRDSSGQITVPATPTIDSHAASKSYVDGKTTALQNNIDGIDDRVMNLESNAGGGGGGGAYGSLPEVLTVWDGTGIFEFQCPDPVDLYHFGVWVQWKDYNNSHWNTSFAILNTMTEAHEYFDFPVWDAGEWMTDRYWLGITTLGSGDITVAIENPEDYVTNRQFRVTVVKLS